MPNITEAAMKELGSKAGPDGDLHVTWTALAALHLAGGVKFGTVGGHAYVGSHYWKTEHDPKGDAHAWVEPGAGGTDTKPVTPTPPANAQELMDTAGQLPQEVQDAAKAAGEDIKRHLERYPDKSALAYLSRYFTLQPVNTARLGLTLPNISTETLKALAGSAGPTDTLCITQMALLHYASSISATVLIHPGDGRALMHGDHWQTTESPHGDLHAWIAPAQSLTMANVGATTPSGLTLPDITETSVAELGSKAGPDATLHLTQAAWQVLRPNTSGMPAGVLTRWEEHTVRIAREPKGDLHAWLEPASRPHLTTDILKALVAKAGPTDTLLITKAGLTQYTEDSLTGAAIDCDLEAANVLMHGRWWLVEPTPKRDQHAWIEHGAPGEGSDIRDICAGNAAKAAAEESAVRDAAIVAPPCPTQPPPQEEGEGGRVGGAAIKATVTKVPDTVSNNGAGERVADDHTCETPTPSPTGGSGRLVLTGSVSPIPEAVTRAFEHVRTAYPDVTEVVFDTDARWEYKRADGSAPNFEGQIDVSILEAAADALTSVPACYGVREGRFCSTASWLICAGAVRHDWTVQRAAMKSLRQHIVVVAF